MWIRSVLAVRVKGKGKGRVRTCVGVRDVPVCVYVCKEPSLQVY